MEPQYSTVDYTQTAYNPYNCFDIIEDQKQIIKGLKQENEKLKKRQKEILADAEKYKQLYEEAMNTISFNLL